MVKYSIPECEPIKEKHGNTEVFLCIHGFCASPATFRPYVDQILSAGYDVYAPLLSGHGTKYQDMLEVTSKQWVEDVCTVFENLVQKYEKVHIFGVSMGGGLGAYLAGHYADCGKIGKVLLLVPGFGLRNKEFHTMDYSTAGTEKIPLIQQSMLTPELTASAFVYEYMYLRSIGELVKICNVCGKELSNIQSPVWIIYSANDPVVDPEAIENAAKEITSLRLLEKVEHSGHNILLDDDCPKVLSYVEECLNAEI